MLTPLLAKIKQEHPHAEIFMTMQKSIVPLYSSNPYNVKALGFSPNDTKSFRDLFRQGPYDIAFIPGDNRYSWLACAMGARWIVAFCGDKPNYKNWPINEFHNFPSSPLSWPDINTLLVAGNYPKPFNQKNWRKPHCKPIPDLPNKYVVLHIGASSTHKLWQEKKWVSVAQHIKQKGFDLVWSCGPGEKHLLHFIPEALKGKVYPGNLSLSQIWLLLKKATILICPDTGIAHIARITNTPTICLYGPGSPQLYGDSKFWPKRLFINISKPVSCRNQHNLFKRQIDWVSRCSRGIAECKKPICMHAIDQEDVISSFEELISYN